MEIAVRAIINNPLCQGSSFRSQPCLIGLLVLGVRVRVIVENVKTILRNLQKIETKR